MLLVSVARALRARLPAGAAEGAFCAALTTVAGAVAFHGANDAIVELQRLSWILGGLSVAWFVAGLVPARRDETGNRKRVFHSWSLLCGALTLGNAVPLCTSLGEYPLSLVAFASAAVGTSILVLVPLRWEFKNAVSAALMTTLAIIEWLIAAIMLNGFNLTAKLSTIAAALALIALTVEVGDELLIWNTTRRRWPLNPESALLPHRRRLHHAPFTTLNFLAVVAAVVSITHPLSAASLAISAIAWFVAYHRHAGAQFASAGAITLALCILSASLAWLPGNIELLHQLAHPRTAAGLAAASIFLNWLARFWAQQLRDGRPWTTAGHLIPVVNHYSILSGFASVGVTVSFLFQYQPRLDVGAATLAICGFLGLIAALRLATFRLDAAQFEAAQFCAWPVGLASAMLLAESAEIGFEGGGIRWLLPAAVAFGLSLRGAIFARHSGFTISGMSWISGAVPVIVTLLAVGTWSIRNAYFASAAITIVLAAAWIGIRTSRARRAESKC